MKESILDVLLYLFEHYFTEDADLVRDHDSLRSGPLFEELGHVEIAEAPLERVETRSAATISARAFAPLDRLIDLSARFSTESTRWLLPKGRNAVKELALLPEPWQRMFHVEQSRTDADSRILVGRGKIAAKQRGKR